MSWIAGVVGAGASIYSTYGQKRAQDALADTQEQSLEEALKSLSPKKISKLQNKLIPFFRAQLNAAGAGNLGESMRAHLQSSGELNTPVGQALLDAANAAPSLTAFQKSLDAAMSIKMQKTQILGSAFPYLQPKSSIGGADFAASAGMGAARGVASYKMLNPQTPAPYSYSGGMQDFSNWINANPSMLTTGTM